MHSFRFVFTLLAVVDFISINYNVNGFCVSNLTEVTEPLVGHSPSFSRYGDRDETVVTQQFNSIKYTIKEQEYIYDNKIYRCVNFPDNFNDEASSVLTDGNAVFGFEHGNCEGDIACFNTSNDACQSLREVKKSRNAQVIDINNFGSFNDKLSSALLRLGSNVTFYKDSSWFGEYFNKYVESCFNVPSHTNLPTYDIQTNGKCVKVYEKYNCFDKQICFDRKDSKDSKNSTDCITQCKNSCSFGSLYTVSYKYCSY